ncbi:MAG: hypothetical protein LBT51_06355 [Fusobacteriaceae bacterium]|jgi:K+-sensing histidine kinase KdpD|nr:hypothetical protein [Fusobacteriaceae bacterium]
MNFLRGFSIWKLHTFQDYLSFFTVFTLGILFFYFITKYLKKQRTKEYALSKISKKLRKLSKKLGVFSTKTDIIKNNKNTDLDIIFVDGRNIILIKVFWWGLHIKGESSGEHWEIADNKNKELVRNPLFDLNSKSKYISDILNKNNKEYTITPLVIFADNFAIPKLKLDKDSCSIVYKDLKKWYKKNIKPNKEKINSNDILNLIVQ